MDKRKWKNAAGYDVDTSEPAKLLKKYSAIETVYEDSMLVTLNDEKLAILCRSGLRDLMSTSTISLHVLERAFGPCANWTKPAVHLFAQKDDHQQPDLLISISKESTGRVSSLKELEVLNTFLADPLDTPDENNKPTLTNFELIRTCNPPVIMALCVWTEGEISLSGMLDLKYVTSIPSFNATLLKYLRDTTKKLEPIKNLLKGVEFSMHKDLDYGLTTSNVPRGRKKSKWSLHEFTFEGEAFLVESRYDLNPNVLSSTYDKDVSDRFCAVEIITSGYSWPRMINLAILSDCGALTCETSGGSAFGFESEGGGGAGGGGGGVGGGKTPKRSRFLPDELDEFEGGAYKNSLSSLNHWKNYWK